MAVEKEDIFKAIDQNQIDSVQKLISQKNNLEKRNESGATPLLYACQKRTVKIAEILIKAGANVNTQDKTHDSPFLLAGASGLTEIVKLCMANGADYKVYNRYGGSALIPACEKGHLETVAEILKDKKFPINHVNNLGWTALMEVMVIGKGGIERQTQITKLLIDAGCDVNILDKEGISALTHAKNNGYKEIISLLEKAGAR